MTRRKRATHDIRHERHHALTVIFKGTSRCNGGCRFCSVGSASGGTIAADDFELLSQQLETLVDAWKVQRLTFTFHGGEPTLLGHETIDSMCTRVRSIADRVDFNMQTNLLSIADEMLEVASNHAIRLGTSFDPICGDRRTKNGRDVYPIWRESFVRLAGRGLSPGAIFVVTRGALGQARRLYHIAEALGVEAGHRFGLQVNPVYPQGYASGSSDLLVTPKELGQFLVELWRVWNAADRSITLSPIQQFVANLTGERDSPASCSFSGHCEESHLGIDHDLNVSSCGRGLDSRVFMGNLRDLPLLEILEHAELRQRIARRDEALRRGECRDCRFFPICHGGCPDDAMLSTGSHDNKVTLCEGYRMLFEAIENECSRPRRRDAPGVTTTSVDRLETEIIVATDPIASERRLDAKTRQELWLLPQASGAAFRFGSPLKPLKGGADRQLRLFVHNHNVRRLALWEDMLHRPGVSVVLFESAGLKEALETLNALGSVVELDVLRLLASPGGAAQLEGVVRRFLHDKDWVIQLFPFTFILINTIWRREARMVRRWGIRPGTIKVTIEASEEDLEPDAAFVLETLVHEASRDPKAHRDTREACSKCSFLPQCGSCLAPGDGSPCSDDARRLVEMIVEAGRAARELQPQMRES